ncbi:MAG: DUF6062 family protein [Saccharofermentanales bacterium]|jgi:hypothetical protein
MKEKIYTIPVNDAYATPGPCPLCNLEADMNQKLVDYYLGPALMEPDVRISTNNKGFCQSHLDELYDREDNRLGLGLTLHTHIDHVIGQINPLLSASAPTAKSRFLGGRQKDFRKAITDLAGLIEQRADSCVICDRLDYTMDRYIDVIFYQYFVDSTFKNRFDNGDGYCLRHLALLLRGAARHLNQNQASELLQSLATMQNRSMEALRDDVEWFTLKFDYRNHHKDWKNSKDALPRAIAKLSGSRKRQQETKEKSR